ncbi:hypothetical protein RMSM_04149 [Rhodopirellula maiorica SM1]|uniref:Uncharacterized protein n=1 Tax=Rhodopirellula maiorica SM1 TaxID=1265738 RepID=M5RHZ0_9BACT|nr:hypothetical protein RMSM_04149 [Rhodopirellula maiorica SM1]
MVSAPRGNSPRFIDSVIRIFFLSHPILFRSLFIMQTFLSLFGF